MQRSRVLRVLAGLGCIAAVGFSAAADIQLPQETAQLKPAADRALSLEQTTPQ